MEYSTLAEANAGALMYCFGSYITTCAAVTKMTTLFKNMRCSRRGNILLKMTTYCLEIRAVSIYKKLITQSPILCCPIKN